MNIFAGIGKIVEVNMNGKVLKFNLSILQEKPCYVPCVLFDPDDEVIKFVEQLQLKKRLYRCKDGYQAMSLNPRVDQSERLMSLPFRKT